MPINRVAIVLLLTWFASSASADVIDVYIAAGQSNLDGRGLISDLDPDDPLLLPQANARIWYANPAAPDTTETDYSSGWQTLGPGYSVPPGFDPTQLPSNTFGPELSFASAISNATGTPNEIAIVKVSKGGTSIRESRGEWHGNPNDNPGYLFNSLISEVDAALAAIEAEGNTGVLRGVLWHQGEADRNFDFYIPNLAELIDGVRSELNVDDLPFVIGELSRQRDDNATFNSNAAALVNDPNSINLGLVSSIGLATDDTTHFDAESQVLLGQRFAQTLAPLVVSVPEPTSIHVLYLGGLVMLRRRRKR